MTSATSQTRETAPAPLAVDGALLGRVVRAVYYSFMIAIPLETILYWQQDPQDPSSSISVARIIGLILLALAVVDWRSCFRKIPAPFWLVGAYLLAFSLSQLGIPAALYAHFHAQQMTYFQMAGLFLVSYNLMLEPKFRESSLRIYGWWIALVAVGMLTGVLGVQFDTTEARTSIATQDPNVAAGMFALGVLCLMADRRLLSARRSLGLVMATLLSVVVLVTAILRTGSRGGLLALAAGLIGLAVCAGASTRRARLAVVGVVLGLAGGLIFHEFQRGSSTAERLQRTWEEGDTAGRTEIYDTALAMFHERPLLGWGGANNNFELGARLNFPERDTHNTFLAALTQVGLVGSLPFFLALLEVMRRAWRGARRGGDALPFALMCCLLVTNSSITGYNEKMFWIVLAAAAAVGA